MNNNTFRHVWINQVGQTRAAVILCQPVIIPGYEQFSLATHESPDYPGQYRVSETLTGRAVSLPCDTPEEAIGRTIAFLANITPQALGERIAYYLLGPGREEQPQ